MEHRFAMLIISCVKIHFGEYACGIVLGQVRETDDLKIGSRIKDMVLGNLEWVST